MSGAGAGEGAQSSKASAMSATAALGSSPSMVDIGGCARARVLLLLGGGQGGWLQKRDIFYA